MSIKFGLKNHVTDAAPGTFNASDKLFGVSQSRWLEAVYGDEAAIRELVDKAQVAEEVKKNIPIALEAAKSVIQATNDLNVAAAEYAKEIGKNAPTTIQAIYDTKLTEQKLGNTLNEKKTAFNNNIDSETLRHEQAIKIEALRHVTNRKMAIARFEANQGNQQLRLQQEARKYDLQRLENERQLRSGYQQELWTNGSRTPKPLANNIWDGIRNALGI